ncbi:MAG: DUF4112 domain-containing protein [Myxococcales bacterium]|nr:DUF4112 domain-containing protein [Myxococcales bacterium]
MSTAAITLSPTTSPGPSARSRRAASAAVERVMGEDFSPELKRVATDVVAPWAEKLVRALDDMIRIPGTKFGIGLDPIIGFLLPGAGDAITGTGSIALLFLALKERVPTMGLLRMVMNILIDTVGGLLPVAGDAFDLVWRSNKRNLEIIEQYREDPKRKPTLADYFLVGVGLVLAVLSIVVPIFIIYGLGFGVVTGIGHLLGAG